MKYVVFKFRSIYMPVIFPDHVTHSQVKIKGATPVSAGFFNERTCTTYSDSASLKLEPHERDADLLCRVMANSSTSLFLEINNK